MSAALERLPGRAGMEHEAMKEHIVKPCPRCAAPLEIKVNRATGKEFLGCSNWQPRGMGCAHTEPLHEAIILRRQGQPDMFEMEEGQQ